jgi:hypothetical protein
MNSPYQPQIEALEKIYGKATDTGFGSAVFHGAAAIGISADSIALVHYKSFMGKQWDAQSEGKWMGSWKTVYERPPGIKADILAELATITDPCAKTSIPLLTELVEDAANGTKALAAAFNHPDVTSAVLHTIGDGEAMSGLILTALYNRAYACSVIALMD